MTSKLAIKTVPIPGEKELLDRLTPDIRKNACHWNKKSKNAISAEDIMQEGIIRILIAFRRQPQEKDSYYLRGFVNGIIDALRRETRYRSLKNRMESLRLSQLIKDGYIQRKELVLVDSKILKSVDNMTDAKREAMQIKNERVSGSNNPSEFFDDVLLIKPSPWDLDPMETRILALELLEKLEDRISPRDMEIFLRHMSGEEEKSIGSAFGINESRVSQILTEIKKTARKIAASTIITLKNPLPSCQAEMP